MPFSFKFLLAFLILGNPLLTLNAADRGPTPISQTITVPKPDGRSGTVKLVAAVDEEGIPTAIKVISSTDDSLNQDAIDSLLLWRFTPAQKDGRDAVGLFDQTFTFTESHNPQIIKTRSKPSSTSDETKIIEAASPELPIELRNIKGSTTALLFVDHHGKVIESTIVGYTHSELIDPTLEAVKKWRFTESPIKGSIRKIKTPLNFKGLPHHSSKDFRDNDSLEHSQKSTPIRQPIDPVPANVRAKSETIDVSYIIDQFGFVTNAEVKSGSDPSLISTVLNSIYKWKYLPAIDNNTYIPVKTSKRFYLENNTLTTSNNLFDTPPRVIEAPKPTLKKRTAHLEGHVIVNLAIDEKGNVTGARIAESSNEKLDDSTLKASYKWKFRPASKDNHPAPSYISIPFIYPLINN